MVLLHTLCVVLLGLGVLGSPVPGRVPKVYNALITSGQNLQPSKSYPIYQPIFQGSFGFPLQPAFYYGDDFKEFYSDGLVSAAEAPKINFPEATSASDILIGGTGSGLTPGANPSATGVPEVAKESSEKSASPAPPPPAPATQSPIPLNEFGLPPAIVPLSGPEQPRPSFAFDPFANFAPYYPQLDPYSDPYGLRSYPLLPSVYRLTPPHEASLQPPVPPETPANIVTSTTAKPNVQSASSAPPPAPSDLDVKNYNGKDPNIPDVPPPPLPSGGFKE